ncbi:MAG: hypothetical protein H6738_01110 [Alphaproteobacteria bacterium]|nr:hypothetical protein [Alphaproteobacteria bacterium]MCB9695366.1 hypothetical protein [Alphaproteobacteria bacterium]
MDDRPKVTENGRMWAVLSYASFLIGFPIGILPLLMRDDEFALYHAKHSTAVWLAVFATTMLLTLMYTGVFFATCGVGAFFVLPLFLAPAGWAMVTGIHGLILAVNDEWQEPFGTFGLGEALFSKVEVDPTKVKRPLLTGPVEPEAAEPGPDGQG